MLTTGERVNPSTVTANFVLPPPAPPQKDPACSNLCNALSHFNNCPGIYLVVVLPSRIGCNYDPSFSYHSLILPVSPAWKPRVKRASAGRTDVQELSYGPQPSPRPFLLCPSPVTARWGTRGRLGVWRMFLIKECVSSKRADSTMGIQGSQ